MPKSKRWCEQKKGIVVTNTCSTDDCNLTAKYDNKCALHCEKGKYQEDRRNGKLIDFYEDLISYINNELSQRPTLEFKRMLLLEKSRSPDIDNDNELFKTLLLNDNSSLNKLISKQIIYFGNIVFPDREQRDNFDFFKLFKKFKGIHLDLSTIYFGSLNLPDVKLFLQDCTILNDWSIHPYSILLDVVNQTVFQNCIFQADVSTSSEENSRDILKVEHHLFNDCQFNKKLSLLRGVYDKSIFNNSMEFRQSLPYLHIEKCEFKDRFELNNADVTLLKIKNMEFEGKFELKENHIKQIIISNVNFKKLFDAYKTKFEQFKISRSIFEKFTGFEKCQFGIKSAETSQPTEFEYVTFLDFTNFRKAKFYNGLDFEHTNLKEPLNFLNAEINDKNTNRETYRIIKHSFDNIGNQLEANKYFSFEMGKYKEELKSELVRMNRIKNFRLLKNKAEKKKLTEIRFESKGKLNDIKNKLRKEVWNYRIYKINEFFSNFGENFLKPAQLMFLSAFLYYLLVLGYENNLLYQFDELTNEFINDKTLQLNLFAKGIPPYGRFLKEGMEFITLIFHIFFLTCTWQFIVAVKRRTKR